MVRASSVLASPRAWAFAGLAAAVGAYYAWSASLWNTSLWWDVAFLALVEIPAVFGLVYLALPLRRGWGLLPLGLALILLTWLLEEAGLDALANFGKLAAAAALAFWLLEYFESAGWVVAVALAIPWIDAYSVWRGPTGNIIEHHPQVFTSLSFALPLPGEHDAARLGPPDLLFFALFLAAAARFDLRTRLTGIALVASLGVTIAVAVAVDSNGLPALPGLSLGFLLPNADLLWRSLSEGRRSRRRSPSDRDGERGP